MRVRFRFPVHVADQLYLKDDIAEVEDVWVTRNLNFQPQMFDIIEPGPEQKDPLPKIKQTGQKRTRKSKKPL